MKIKSLLVGLASVGVAVSAFSQGQVNFANGSISLVQVDIGTAGNPNIVNAPASVYGTRVQLYYAVGSAPVASSLANNFDTTGWTTVGNLGTATASNGRFSVGTTTFATVTGGTSVWLEAIAWTGTSGTLATAVTTLSAALQGASTEVGSSGVWSQVLGDPNATPPGTPTPTAGPLNALGNIVLRPVPEPSTIALAGLGAASLLLFRRK